MTNILYVEDNEDNISSVQINAWVCNGKVLRWFLTH